MKRKYEYEALGTRVLAVSVANYLDNGELFDWAAYVDSVAGVNHEKEYEQVSNTGSKLRKEVATALFPGLDADKWRY